MSEAARILTAIENGDRQAAEQLLPLVYDELRRLAARKLKNEPPGQTLQATALVHEAYLRLVGDAPDRQWNGRSHFFAAAAQAMRHILVEAARRKRRQKRGGGIRRVDLADVPAPDPDEALLALDDALNRLASEDPVAAKVIELRQFAGLGHEEIAAALGITVYARAPEMDLCEGLAGRRPRRLNRSSGTINSTTAYGARTRKPRHKPLFAIRGGRGSVRAACGEPGRAEWANGSPGGSPSRNRAILSRTIRCRSTRKRVQAVFLSAVECHDPAARAAVLDRECSTDAELRQRVEALLLGSRSSPTASSINRSSSLNTSVSQPQGDIVRSLRSYGLHLPGRSGVRPRAVRFPRGSCRIPKLMEPCFSSCHQIRRFLENGPPPPSLATRSWASSAEAAWASSTGPVRSA